MKSNLEIKKIQDGIKFNTYTKITEQQKKDDQQADDQVFKQDKAQNIIKSDIVTMAEQLKQRLAERKRKVSLRVSSATRTDDTTSDSSTGMPVKHASSTRNLAATKFQFNHDETTSQGKSSGAGSEGGSLATRVSLVISRILSS